MCIFHENWATSERKRGRGVYAYPYLGNIYWKIIAKTQVAIRRNELSLIIYCCFCPKTRPRNYLYEWTNQCHTLAAFIVYILFPIMSDFLCNLILGSSKLKFVIKMGQKKFFRNFDLKFPKNFTTRPIFFIFILKCSQRINI